LAICRKFGWLEQAAEVCAGWPLTIHCSPRFSAKCWCFRNSMRYGGILLSSKSSKQLFDGPVMAEQGDIAALCFRTRRSSRHPRTRTPAI
jgi:hypothetical protein